MANRLSDLQLSVTDRLTTPDDPGVTALASLAGTSTLGLGTCCVGWFLTTLGLAVTTTVRVTVVTHGHTTGSGTTTEPSLATRLAEHHVLVIGVADLADGRSAINRDLANFTGRQHQGGPATFLIGQTSTSTGGTTELGSATGLHLDAVHREAGGNAAERHAVAGLGLDDIT